ncbi:MAG: NAD(P)-dependent oxidoreductase [Gemmatimonadota bacterium]|nr:NAD(P)-dependent oxidoreductase [Gemmatimonadota bacterium]
MNLLVTGAAGRVGTILVRGLKDRYTIRGFDRSPMPDLDDTVYGDNTDMAALVKAAEGVDAIIHLSGNPSGGAPWEDILKSNIIGTYNLFEAARQSGVSRIAFASRAGLLAPYPKKMKRTINLPTKPESYYSVSKVFGESIGYMYSARFDMEVVSVRIGNFIEERDKPEHPHHLSHGDLVKVFEQAVTHPDVKFEIVFGVSGSTCPMYDLDHGRRAIGYDPGDTSEFKWDE